MNDTAHLTADDRGVVLHCPKCQRANRIPFPHLHQNGQCGNCKAALPHAALPVGIDSASSFAAMIRAASLPVLVDFWVPWCGPCEMVAPEVGKLAAITSGELLVAKVNTEAQPGIAGGMGIRSIPTFAVFFDGREIERDVRCHVGGATGRVRPARDSSRKDRQMMRLTIAMLIGASPESARGYFGQYSSGTCPLASTWWRGAIYGAVRGLLFGLGGK